MLMNVLQEHTSAVLMLNVIILRDHTAALANLDFLEVDDNAKVNQFQIA